MNRAAIHHEPLSHLAFAADKNTLVFRLITAKEDKLDVYFRYGDTAFQGHPVPFESIPMVGIAETQNHRIFECQLKNSFPRLVYFFEIQEGATKTYYYADHFHDTLSSLRNDFFKYPYHQISDVISIPKWYQESVVYNIFPDSFTGSLSHSKECENETRQKHGGTLKAILERLDYIEELGITCIYLNPIFKASEYHKYDTIDYFEIDPCFGTKEDFRALVDALHTRGMAIVLDGVFNHVGHSFAPFKAWLKDPIGQYKDWFFPLKNDIYYPDESTPEALPYASFGYERHMPKINVAHPDVQAYFLTVARYWMETFSIDGWRLDVADEAHYNFWRRFRVAVKSINPEAILIAENWQTSRGYLDGSTFDGLMNYDLMNHIKAFWASQTLTARQFGERLHYQLTRYRTMHTQSQLNFLNSHDVPRLFSLIDHRLELMAQALVFLFTFTGVPMIYYGDEIPLGGLSEDEYRQAMPSNTQAQFYDLIKLLANHRKRHPEWVYGKFNVLPHDSKDMLIYSKTLNSEKVIVIINRSAATQPIPDFKGTELISKHSKATSIGPYGYVILHQGD